MAWITTHYTNRKIVSSTQPLFSFYSKEEIIKTYEEKNLLKIKISQNNKPLEEIFIEIIRTCETVDEEGDKFFIVEGVCKKYNGLTYEMENRDRCISDYYPGYLDFKVFLHLDENYFKKSNSIVNKLITTLLKWVEFKKNKPKDLSL